MPLQKTKSSKKKPVTNMDSDKRSQIMASALKLFSEFGFHGVAVPKIAENAGIATGSLYNYFENKEALVNELFLYWKSMLKAYYLEGYPSTANTQQQFVFIWERLHQYAEDQPDAFQFIESQMHASYLKPACLELEDEIFEIGRQFVIAGQKNGDLRKLDAQLIVSLFFGAFVQFFKDTRAGRQKWSLKNSLTIRDLCWKSIALKI